MEIKGHNPETKELYVSGFGWINPVD